MLSAVAESSNDENGLIWPMGIAPFQVHVIAANATDETQRALAERVYQDLCEAGIEALYDDREERAGVKFKDADLIGAPVQIIVGKTAVEGKVEIRDRATKTAEVIPADGVLANISRRIEQADFAALM